MTWSDEVHSSRYEAAIARATAERRLRKRGLPVPVLETAQVGPLMAMVAVASGLVAWQHWGAPVRAALAHNPLVQQFRTLILGPSASAPRSIVNKSSSKGSGGGKVGARKPAVVTPTPGQAAAAAAEARLAATANPQTSPRMPPPIPSRPAQMDPQPQASTSAAAASDVPSHQGGSDSGSGSSKKKKGKKRR